MMRFFHCDTGRYIKRRKYLLWITLLPLIQGSVITSLIVIVNFRAFYEKGYHLPAIRAVTAAAVFGTLVFFATFFITEKAVKRNARYTFFEIGTKALIYSRYSGEYIRRGKRVINRSLYVVPLCSLKKIGYSEKKGRLYLEADGDGVAKIRKYHDSSERLKYKLSDGFPQFESWWYNEHGFRTLTVLKVPAIFGGIEKLSEIAENIAEAKRAFENTPKPKPYVHKEADFIKRKRAIEKLKKQK
ncbi:MAG: hypothetical protein LBC82_06530 [Oscillospiraceae bacterium]|jgi:hypothetical protein|nr:hypothetical protein [Oscillospiraceae bacterium]